MADILPRELPAASSVPGSAALIVDNGVTVEKATPEQITAADTRLLRVPPGEAAPGVASLATAEGKFLRVVSGQIVPSDALVGPTGPAGPADNTYTTLAAFKAQAVTNKAARMVGAPGVTDGSFNWTLGNYTGQADDENIIQSDNEPLTTGAWVRQLAASIQTSTGETVQDVLTPIIPNAYAVNQALFPFSFVYGDGLRSLVDDPFLPNVGGNNHAFGMGALLSLTGVSLNANPNAGYGNCAFGPNVMRVANNAFDNTFMGYEAGRKMVDGFNNAGLGPKTLYECTTGYRNVALGTTSLYSGTSLYENIAIGVDAGFNATTCFGMVLGGYQAGYRVTSASHGVGLGWKALGGIAANDNTSERAVGVGYRALGSATTASDTVAIGANALVSCTTGNGNIAIGSSSLQAVVTGASNTAVGDSSLLAYTGSSATAIGTNALAAATSATGLVAVGYQAGQSITTGSTNTVVGFQVATGLVNGGGNTIFGRSAGTSAGGSGATNLVDGSFNVIIGDLAATLSSSSDNAIILGRAAKAGTNGIAIGAGASAAAATGATSAHDSAQLAFGSSGSPVAVRGDGSLYPTAGASAGHCRVELNDNVYALELKAIA